jgi:uncharacterized membrane protein
MPTLGSLVRDRVTAVWAVLVTATVLSFTLGVEDGKGGHPLLSSIIIVIALFKVRLVGLYFMELRDAPFQLRAIFEAYCLLVCGVLLGLFLIH